MLLLLLCVATRAHPCVLADPFDPDGVAPEEELQRNIKYGTVSTLFVFLSSLNISPGSCVLVAV